MNIVQFTLVFLIRLYQTLLSPVMAAVLGPSARCRFTPSCSQYAREAVCLHGAVRGGWLALRRLGRCHPWGGCGQDLPPAEWKWPHGKLRGVGYVAPPSWAAGSRPVPVREAGTGGETPPQPAGEDACATPLLAGRASCQAIGLAKLEVHIRQNLSISGNYHGS